jgi:hypothetical protein
MAYSIPDYVHQGVFQGIVCDVRPVNIIDLCKIILTYSFWQLGRESENKVNCVIINSK